MLPFTSIDKANSDKELCLIQYGYKKCISCSKKDLKTVCNHVSVRFLISIKNQYVNSKSICATVQL